MKAITLKELAEILNLAPSSVSKALNNSNEISYETKKRVNELAKSYGYAPNQMAKCLKTGNTKTIGLVIPNVKGDFFAMVLHSIEAHATKKNYSIVVHISDDCIKKEKKSLATFFKGMVEGVLISLAKETQHTGKACHLNELQNRGIPIVQFDRVNENCDCDKVSVDDFDGAYRATKHLIKTGCRRIAFLSPISQTSVGQYRRDGYIEALKSEQRIVHPPILIEMDQYIDFKDAINNAFKYNAIDGILAADELSAICAINTVQSMGLQIPNDVSIIGFTDGILAKCSIPSLTTISQHAKEVGKMAVEILINRIEKQKALRHEHKIIKTELNIRNSTRVLVN